MATPNARIKAGMAVLLWYQAVGVPLPSPGGVRDELCSLVGRLTLSAAKCETGWGDLSTRAPPRRTDRHPAPLALRAIDPPPPGEGRNYDSASTSWSLNSPEMIVSGIGNVPTALASSVISGPG